MEQIIQNLLALKDNKEIEKIAKQMDAQDALIALDYLLNNPSDFHKTDPLIAGLSCKTVVELVKHDLNLMRAFSHREVLQHQFMTLAFEFNTHCNTLVNRLNTLQDNILSVTLNEPGQESQMALREIKTLIENLQGQQTFLMDIVWATERPDLIEIYSTLKERLSHLMQLCIDCQKALTNQLQNAFELLDNALAIDGLVSLGYLYKEDWKALLKALGHPNHHEEVNLINEVKQLLHQANLNTVYDLKTQAIFSKAQLVSYLKAFC